IRTSRSSGASPRVGTSRRILVWNARAVDVASAGRTWSDLPYQEGAYTQKVFWWSQGYDWKSPLTLTGRRIDGPAPPMRASTATNAFAADIGSSILVGVVLPTACCWEITGHLKGVTLSFVVWVAP